MMTARAKFGLFCVVALAAVAGCGSDATSPRAPGVEPEVINNTDAFQFQVSAVDGYTGALSYTWANTGTMATVDQSCAVESGEAMVSLYDSAGNEVYTQDLSVDGSYPSIEGTAGNWEVRVQFTSTVGTLNFRAEKATP